MKKGTLEHQWESVNTGKESDKLVTENLKLVHYIVRMFEKDALSQAYQELYAEGVVGLVEAAVRYIPGRAKFATYAYTRIRGSILNYLRLRSPLLRVPKSALNNGIRVNVLSLSPDNDEDDKQIELPFTEESYSFMELLEDIKNRLSWLEYKIVMLKYDGYAQVEISKLLDLSETSISRIMSSVRVKLATVLKV